VRIDQGSDRLGEVGCRGRLFAVMRLPRFEQLDDLTTLGIVGFDPIDALDGIAAAKRQERIAAPFGPFLEAAEWTAAAKVGRVLTTITPNG
jgi:hypothetical protein